MNLLVVSKELWLFYTVSLESLEQVCAGFHPLEELVCLNLELSIFITKGSKHKSYAELFHRFRS